MFDLFHRNFVENRYFKRRATSSDRTAAKKKNSNPEIIASPTEHVKRAGIEMVMEKVKK